MTNNYNDWQQGGRSDEGFETERIGNAIPLPAVSEQSETAEIPAAGGAHSQARDPFAPFGTEQMPVVENPAPFVDEVHGGHATYGVDAASVAPAAPDHKKPSKAVRTFLMGFAGAGLACALAFGGFAAVTSQAGSGDASGGQSASVQLGSSENKPVTGSDDSSTLAESVADKALPSVAAVDVYTKQGSQQSMLGFYGSGSSGDNSGSLQKSSLGSGVVLSKDGYILTNYHVIEGSDALKATVGGKEYEAEVVGTDSSSDLAVIKAKDASDLTPIEVGDSNSLKVGEWVMSIGSPFGLEQSVATGIVSATSRSQIMKASDGSSGASVYANLIQTDAAINPGNSGGALVDSQGKLIGINTLITSYSGNYSGVGFAIPSDYAVNIAQTIIKGEKPTHAQLGVSLMPVNSDVAQRYNLATDSGAYVSSVEQGSGAEKAGLKEGDIVTSFDGKKVESASDLTVNVRSKNPGDKVSLEVNRNGKTEKIEVELGSATVDDSVEKSASTQKESGSKGYGYDDQGNRYGDSGNGNGDQGGDAGSLFDYLFGGQQ